MSQDLRSARTLFIEAIENHLPAEWRAFLDTACGTDKALWNQTWQLLKAHLEISNFMALPVGGMSVELCMPADGPAGPRIGAMIGRYKLLEQIGEGGMGIVYVAVQTEPVHRKVALKIIKPGMDTREVISRFEVERQTLAIMDHPNIARVLDAGATETNRPYFVMELVRGLAITDYCDMAKLTIERRLELFITVCQAVQHAHLKGIIHRDLKPGNVMITLHDGIPVVKVIDFGVAKAMNQQFSQHSVYTAYAQIIGTPLYMSPEQAEMSGLDIDTRSDVYSLGVLLYELLTGQTPFDRESFRKAGIDEMRRIIREEQPARPSRRFNTLGIHAQSTLSQQRGIDERRLKQSLRSELDWIVMKAIEKDRKRRFESSSALAADLRRYLDNEPVEACPPSTPYRLRKVAGKHRAALVAVFAVALSLLVGSGVSIWQALEARQARNDKEEQRKLAEADFDKALEAVDRLLARVGNQTLNDVPGVHGLREDLVKDAVEFYRELEARRPNDLRVQKQLAEVQIQSWGWKWIISKAHVDAEFDAAIASLERLHCDNPDDPEIIAALADGYSKLGYSGPIAGKEESFRRGQDVLLSGLKKFPDNPKLRTYLADLYIGYSRILPEQEQETMLLEIIRLCQPLSSENRHMAADALHRLSDMYASRGDLSKAVEFSREGIRIREVRVKEAPANSIMRAFLAQEQSHLGNLLVQYGRSSEAKPVLLKAFQHSVSAAADNPGVTHYANVLNDVRTSLMQFVVNQGQDSLSRSALIEPHNTKLAAEFFERSRTHLATGPSELALADILEAVKLDPQSMKILDEAYQQSLDHGRMEQARDFARQSVNLPNEKVNNWVRRGEQLQLLGEFSAARAAFSHSTNDMSSDWWIVKRRGVVNFLMEDYEASLRDFQSAIQGAPQDIFTLQWLDPQIIATCPSDVFRSGLLKMADELIENYPKPVGHQLVRGLLRKSFGNSDGAVADFEALLHSPDSTAFDLYLLALIFLDTSNEADYRRVCHRITELFGDSVDGENLYWMGWTLILSESDEICVAAGLKATERALTNHPFVQRHLMARGATLYRAGRFELARSTLLTANEAPSNANSLPVYIWYFLAMTEHRLGNSKEAARWLAKASGFRSGIRPDAESGRYRLSWSRRLALDLLEAESAALLTRHSEQ